MTLAEFRDHLADQIGIKMRGNALSADDANYLETVILNCHGELEQLGVALWPVEDIPTYAIENFALYCEASIRAFGLSLNPVVKKFALDALRYLTSDGQVGIGKACYF